MAAPKPDHPRSRGVYRSSWPPWPVACWIIPARAGFTRPSLLLDTAPRDHPRSRGVYTIHLSLRSLIEGSSPLARGLPRVTEELAVVLGIIPARAGFTT